MPDDVSSSEEVIIAAANTLVQGDEVTVTFLQVGDDKRADDYLDEMSTRLNCKFNIVDSISCKALGSCDLSTVVSCAISM